MAIRQQKEIKGIQTGKKRNKTVPIYRLPDHLHGKSQKQNKTPELVSELTKVM